MPQEKPKKTFREHAASMLGSTLFVFSLLAARDLIWFVGSSLGLSQSASMLCVLVPLAIFFAFRDHLAKVDRLRSTVRVGKQ